VATPRDKSRGSARRPFSKREKERKERERERGRNAARRGERQERSAERRPVSLRCRPKTRDARLMQPSRSALPPTATVAAVAAAAAAVWLPPPPLPLEANRCRGETLHEARSSSERRRIASRKRGIPFTQSDFPANVFLQMLDSWFS